MAADTSGTTRRPRGCPDGDHARRIGADLDEFVPHRLRHDDFDV
jgi:hypothetical protein